MTAAVPEPSPALVAAREFTARGWRPFPVEYGGKRPAVGIKWGTATASSAPDATLALWFGRDPVNVGIAAKPSGLYILDEDTLGELDRLAADRGEALPETYIVHTAKGRQPYFSVVYTPENEHLLRNRTDIGGYDIDARGAGEQNGGYVVAAGSLHATGVEYTAQDSAADAVPLPEWVLDWLREVDSTAQETTKDAPDAEPDRERRYTMDQAVDWVTRYAVGPLKAAVEGGRNDALNTAAIVVGHFVPAFWSQEWAVDRLAELAAEVGLDDAEILPTIRSGMRAGQREPYALVEYDPFASGSGASGTEPDPFELAVATELHRLQVLEEARRRHAALRRAERPPLAAGVLDDLDAIEPPPMLLGSLIPDAAVGFLAGRSGAYKSFLATAWACCVATGRPWLDRPEFAVSRPLRTLYVAAEGAAGAAGRIKAWEATTGVSRRGRLLLYPRAIHLNDTAQVGELAAYVAEQGIEFVVIDTYHRSAPGIEENSSTDFGAVFEAVARLRDEHGCASLFVDHTGAGKAGNPRGTSAKRDDADYVLSTSYLGEEAAADAQRELWVTKLKDTDTSGRWPIRLATVDGAAFPVVEIGSVSISTPFGSSLDDGDWWRADRVPEIPQEVAERIANEAAKTEGRGADAARWIWRLLAFVDDDQGLTRAEIATALAVIPRDKPITKEAVNKAIPLLERAGVIDRDRTRNWLAK